LKKKQCAPLCPSWSLPSPPPPWNIQYVPPLPFELVPLPEISFLFRNTFRPYFVGSSPTFCEAELAVGVHLGHGSFPPPPFSLYLSLLLSSRIPAFCLVSPSWSGVLKVPNFNHFQPILLFSPRNKSSFPSVVDSFPHLVNFRLFLHSYRFLVTPLVFLALPFPPTFHPTTPNAGGFFTS